MSPGDFAVRSVYRTLLRSYGVEVVVESDNEAIFEHVKSIAAVALVGRITFEDFDRKWDGPKYSFLTDDDGQVKFDIAGVSSGDFKENDIGFDRYLNGAFRSHIAAYSRNWVFIHAGVVEWKGRALIFPGHSHKGKTTLVSELIRLGAGYMSDEYAVIDQSGLIYPFERDLGVRPAAQEGPIPTDPAAFGGQRRHDPVEPGMVLFTGFVENGKWDPTPITVGRAILEAVPEVIPMSFNTEFVLKVLNTTFKRAILVRSDRGEARDTAPKVLDFFENMIMSGTEPQA